MKNNSRLLVLIGAVLMQVSIGSVYSWTLFNEALHSKFHWNLSDILFTYSLIIFVFAFTTILSGRLLDRFGSRKIAAIGGTLYGIGLLLTSQADSLIELYIFYGVIAGIGVGFVYVCPLATSVKWFPRNKGVVTGIVVGAFGVGSLVFKNVIQYLIDSQGVSESFFYLGIIYLVLTLVGALLLKEPSKSGVNLTDSFTNGEVHSVRTIVKTKNFYLIWISYLLACIGGLLVIGSAVEIGIESANLSYEKAAMAVVVISLFNALGRLSWGAISDKIGSKRSAQIMFIISTISLLTISIYPLETLSFYILVALITFCFGGFLVIYPTITSDYFGLINIGRNYGVVYQAYGVAALLGPLILKISSTLSVAFIISSICSIVGLLFISNIKGCSNKL